MKQLYNYNSIERASIGLGKTQNHIRKMIVKEYGKNIKRVCSSCGNKIKYSVSRYYTSGNTCPKCSTQATIILEARKIYNRLVESAKNTDEIKKELEKLLKDNNIKHEDLFLSINFYNSAITFKRGTDKPL